MHFLSKYDFDALKRISSDIVCETVDSQVRASGRFETTPDGRPHPAFVAMTIGMVLSVMRSSGYYSENEILFIGETVMKNLKPSPEGPKRKGGD